MNPDKGAAGDQRVHSDKPAVVFVVACLLAVLVVGWLSLVTQPTALASTAWWPVADIAVGLGIRFPRRHIWPWPPRSP